MPWWRLLSLFGVFLCLWHQGICNAKKARMSPTNVYAEVGHNMEVSCTLLDKGLALGLTSSDLNFSWYEQSNTTLITSHYVTQHNATTAALLLPNMQKGKDGYQLWCHAPTQRDLLDGVYVHVGYKPKPSVVLSVSADNWQTLAITWSKELNPVFKTTTTAYWKANKELSFHVCPNQHREGTLFSCWFSLLNEHLDRSTYFQIKINSSNLLGTSTTRAEMETFYLVDINKPQGVRELSVWQKGSHWMELTWGSTAPSGRGLLYSINVSCRHPEQTQVPITSERIIIRNITGLLPGTWCRITVAARSQDSNLWSDSRTIYETTNDSVPTGFPGTISGGFDIRSLDTERKITLYWQPMPIEHRGGNITKYKITRRSRHSGTLRTYEDEVPSGECCHHEMKLDLNTAYNISLVARTSAGYNKNMRPQRHVLILPQVLLQSQSPKNVTALVTATKKIEVWWTLQEGSEYTGYWCRLSRSNDAKHCNGTVTWETGVTSPWTVHSVSADSRQPVDPHWFRFGVSSDLDTSSSGITWSDCVYDLNQKSSSPFVRINPTSSGFSLQLKQPTRCNQRLGFIYAYMVTYCKLRGSQCAAEAVTVIVPRTGKKTAWEVNSLSDNTEYQLVVHSITAAGFSTSSRTSFVATLTGVRTVVNNNLAAILIGCSVGFVFLVIGIVCFVRKCGQKCKLYGKKLKIRIQLPEKQLQAKAESGTIENVSEVTYHNVPKTKSGEPLLSPNKSLPHPPRLPLRNQAPHQQFIVNPSQEPPTESKWLMASAFNGAHGSFDDKPPPAGLIPWSEASTCSSRIPSGIDFGSGEPSVSPSVDEANKQNKFNAQLDSDYNYAPTVPLDTLDGVQDRGQHPEGGPVGGFLWPMGTARTGAASAMDSSRSTSGDESEAYKEAGVLLDPHLLHPDAHSSVEEEEDGNFNNDLDYNYKPAFFSDDSWPPSVTRNLLNDSSPLPNHSLLGSSLNETAPSGWPCTEWATDQKKAQVQPVPLLLLSSELAMPVLNGLGSSNPLPGGGSKVLLAGTGQEQDEHLEDSDDYGYSSVRHVMLPM